MTGRWTRPAAVSQDEADRLIGYMPMAVRWGGVSEWERKFCASIIAKDRAGGFRPTDKQVATMRRIVSRFQEATMRQDADDDARFEDADVVEDEE